MTLSANTAWEIRPTNGSDTNGGGFVAGATGTDWSQQNPAQYAVSNGVTNGTTTITSSTANFGTDVVGNLVYVSGGTGAVVAARYQIVSRTNATTIVVDRSTGLTAGTGVTLNIGGAVKTITVATTEVNTNGAAGNRFYVKAEATIVVTATQTITLPASSPPNAGGGNWLIGYTTTRGDGGRVTIQASTNTGITCLSFTNNGCWVSNFLIDCNGLGTSIGINGPPNYAWIYNCLVKNFTSKGINLSQFSTIQYCEVTAGTAAATSAVLMTASSWIIQCNIHDNSCPGIAASGTSNTVARCLIANNTGIGVTIWYDSSVQLCTIYGNSSTGLAIGNFFHGDYIKGNLIAKNGGFGMTLNGGFSMPLFDGNAFWSNTSGPIGSVDNTTGIHGVAPYTNIYDVVIPGTDPTNDPFTNKAAGDFTLNNVTGAGALLRGTATIGGLPGVAQTGYPDFGCFQHQDAGGASVIVVNQTINKIIVNEGDY